MPERSGGVYKRMDGRPNTRKSERRPAKSYVKGVPGPKIHMFEAGDPKRQFEFELSLVPEQAAQIKHNALEAARVAANKVLSNSGVAYFLKIRVFPHHVLRENPLATGAGADRFSSGMSKAFGKPIGTSARLKKMQKIMSVRVDSANLEIAKDALRRAKMKFPVKCRIVEGSLKAAEPAAKVEEKPAAIVEKEEEAKEKLEENLEIGEKPAVAEVEETPKAPTEEKKE